MGFASKQEKAIALKNSALFDVHKWSDYSEVNVAISHLLAILKAEAGMSVQEKKAKKNLKIIVIDLLANWYADPTRYSSIHRRKPYYTQLASRYNKLYFKYDAMIPVLDALVELEYVEQHLGHYDRDTPGKNRITRIKATPKLIKLLVDDFLIAEGMLEKAPKTECIILREKRNDKQVDIDYEDTDHTGQMRQDLCKYNNLLRDVFITIPEAHKTGIPTENNTTIFVTQHEKFVRRIFNNGSWDDGGRYYGGWWQRIPKESREKIRFWDLATVEVDYSGLHIVLLYALEDIDYWQANGQDPYSIEGLENRERMRRLLKLILLTAINSKNKQEALRAVNWHVNTDLEEYAWVKQESFKIGDIIDTFAKAHKPISNYFFSGIGLWLQNLDSFIAEHVINHFTVKGEPVLCIHDSFIIQASSKTELDRVMDEAMIKARTRATELIVDPEIRKTVSGLELSARSILENTAKWQAEGEVMKGLYEDPDWKRALEEFDDFRYKEDHVDEYYTAD